MAKPSHDQKRKRKLAERKRKSSQVVSLAYMGEKYKTDELIPSLMETEIGIYQAYVMTDQMIYDQTVVVALGRLIQEIRSGKMPSLKTNEIHYQCGQEEELIIENIRQRWVAHFAVQWQPSKDDLIGVLRTILGSIEKVRSPGPRSQAYLRFITGFLTRKLGVSVKEVSAGLTPLPEPQEDELVLLGRRWNANGDPEARAEFFEQATNLMRNGEVSRVSNACHQLIGEISDPTSEISCELLALVHQPRESLSTEIS